MYTSSSVCHEEEEEEEEEEEWKEENDGATPNQTKLSVKSNYTCPLKSIMFCSYRLHNANFNM